LLLLPRRKRTLSRKRRKDTTPKRCQSFRCPAGKGEKRRGISLDKKKTCPSKEKKKKEEEVDLERIAGGKKGKGKREFLSAGGAVRGERKATKQGGKEGRKTSGKVPDSIHPVGGEERNSKASLRRKKEGKKGIF